MPSNGEGKLRLMCRSAVDTDHDQRGGIEDRRQRSQL